MTCNIKKHRERDKCTSIQSSKHKRTYLYIKTLSFTFFVGKLVRLGPGRDFLVIYHHYLIVLPDFSLKFHTVSSQFVFLFQFKVIVILNNWSYLTAFWLYLL